MGKDKHKVIDLSKGFTPNQQPEARDLRLEPGVIIVHVAMVPSTNTAALYRSERAVPPKNNQEILVEIQNWFNTLANGICILLSQLEKFGVPHEKMVESLVGLIKIYFESGGLSGKREKIVVNTTKTDNGIKAVVDSTKPKFNYDSEILSLGFKSLGNETYQEYCANVGLAFRTKERMPMAEEFLNAIVFRKEIATEKGSFFLEIGREKNPVSGPLDGVFSKYLVAMVSSKPEYQRNFYWQITKPEETKTLLALIEDEAKKLAEVLY